jgi:protein gp37
MFTEKRQYGQDPEAIVRSKTTFRAPLKWREPSLVFTCSWSDWLIEEADEWRDEAYRIIFDTPHTYQILTKRSKRFPLVPRTFSVEPRIWWGVSVENRKHGLPRVDDLRGLVGANRFLSIEPLLEDLGAIDLSGIGWVIIGGESGPKRRPFNLEWLAKIVDQCSAVSVPCFVKQDSAFRSGQQGRIPDELFVRQFPAGMMPARIGATDGVIDQLLAQGGAA